jgi:hypothetical protein
MTRTILAFGATLLLVGAAHAGCFVTLGAFKALKMGASYQEATEVIGCEGDETARTTITAAGIIAVRLCTDLLDTKRKRLLDIERDKEKVIEAGLLFFNTCLKKLGYDGEEVSRRMKELRR